jgi:hypothetical protein
MKTILLRIAFAAVIPVTCSAGDLFTFTNHPFPNTNFGGNVTDDPIYTLGEIVTWTWNTKEDNYSFVLWQQFQNRGAAAAGATIYIKTSSDPEVGTFNWAAQVYNFNISDSMEYFLRVGYTNRQPDDPYLEGSYYFNITDKASSSSTTSSSTVSTSSSSSSTSTISPPAITTSSIPPPNPSPVALGAGLGVGIPVAIAIGLLIGYFLWRRRSAYNSSAKSGVASNGYGKELFPDNDGNNHPNVSQMPSDPVLVGGSELGDNRREKVASDLDREGGIHELGRDDDRVTVTPYHEIDGEGR